MNTQNNKVVFTVTCMVRDVDSRAQAALFGPKVCTSYAAAVGLLMDFVRDRVSADPEDFLLFAEQSFFDVTQRNADYVFDQLSYSSRKEVIEWYFETTNSDSVEAFYDIARHDLDYSGLPAINQ